MRCDDDGKKNQPQYADTSHGKRILAQASHTILEECGRLTHNILLLLFLICRLLEICLIEFAQIYLCRQNLSMFQLITSIRPFVLYSNVILGSTNLYAISVSRFATTIRIARKIVVAIIIV